jgi:predicted Rossmann fold flavoprotein
MRPVLANDTWDVAVIGGGPAGMMAAGTAAAGGAQVVLVEKNNTLGKKLLITGGGRCNVTNAESDLRTLLAAYKEADQFLFSPFSKLGVEDTLAFFEGRGMPTKTEAGKRVFPKSDTARSVLDVLTAYLQEGGVRVVSDAAVKSFDLTDGIVAAARLPGGERIAAKTYIVATGGMSRPETGSTGDGFRWLRNLGHAVVDPDPALVPVRIHDAWVKRLQGVSLPKAKITLIHQEKKQEVRKGKMLFTHFGVSGPAILNMSRDISEFLPYGDTFLSLDILPAFDYAAMNAALQQLFAENSNKKLKNSLDSLIPSALVPAGLELSGINPDTPCHSVTREERVRLMHTLKDMRMLVAGLLGTDKAVVTSGGVPLSEVDTKTMRSKIVRNLYIVGDMLDIDRPSGGYSLQLCWTTGYVAGIEAARTAKGQGEAV